MHPSDAHRPDPSLDTLPAGEPDTGRWAESRSRDASPPGASEGAYDPLAATDPAGPPAGSVPDVRFIQQYELIRELGRGGMGVVHLARDLRLGRLVAIKMLTRAGASIHRERFLAEARATARCRHENIVVIHDVDVHDDRPYLVFEYLRGQTLRQWMDARLGGAFDGHDAAGSFGRLPVPLAPGRVAEIMVPVVRALVCAHEMGIIHRDLKPANVMLTEDGVTKVLDFGVAKIDTTRDGASEAAKEAADPLGLTSVGARLGTLPYMSPEQMAGDAVDHRTDIWSVGIILHELVTGAHPLAPLSEFKLYEMAEAATAMPSVRVHRADLGPLADVIDRCLIKNKQNRTGTARELLEQLQSLLPAARARRVDYESNPFAGLAAFQESDADRFFGRDRDIEQIVTELRSRPLVAVVGPSGVGKSSLIRAGVIPALKRSGEGWNACVVRPGRGAVAALAGVLAQMQSTDSTSEGEDEPLPLLDGTPREMLAPVIDRVRVEPGYLGARLRALAWSKLRRILIFVDQFEELWTLGIPPDERAAFLACLAALADDAASPLRVIVSMRSDFLDRLADDRHFKNEVMRGLVLLPPMGREGLREALLRPVEASELRFESATLVDDMVAALEATQGALPLLQFTAARLWELRDTGRRLLTEDSYRKLGGVGGALARHAEDTLARMPPAHQALVREIFRQLVTADGTRAILSRRELRELLGAGATEHAADQAPDQALDDQVTDRVTDEVHDQVPDQVIEELVRARLLVASEGETGEDRVEVVHEALLSSWPRLVSWQHEDAESARLRDQLRAAARQWNERGRSRGLLWRDDALLEYRVWRARYQGALTDAEHEFARASLREETRGRRLRSLAVGAAFLVLCAGLVIVHQQRNRADALAAQSQQRLIALYLEQGRQKLAEGDPLRAFPYLAEARRSGADGAAVRFLLTRSMQFLAGQEQVLRGHEGPVWDARFSPDGARIATASSDKTARIWDADSGALLHTLTGFGADVWRARFSPDGQRLLTASWDGSVMMWNARTGALAWAQRQDGRVFDALFSPDGSLVATLGVEHAIMLREAGDGRIRRTLEGHTAPSTAAAFSADGAYLVTGSDDATARVWSTATGTLLATSPDHGDQLTAVAISPDGRLAASASLSGRACVFPVAGGPALELTGHGDEIYSLAFAPDGTRLVTASKDRTARVWDAATGSLLWTLADHPGPVLSARFTPDGQSILTFAMDGAARRWSARTGRLEWTYLGHLDGIWAADIDAAGDRLVTASADGTARVWAARQQRHVRALRVPGHVLTHASFAPDGEHVATADRSGSVRVWDGQGSVTATMEADYTYMGQPHRVAWSPDGSRLLSSGGARAIVWDARSGARLLELEHGTWVLHASWAPDGARIVTGGKDHEIRVWDAGTGALLRTLTGHEQPVTMVAMEPGGRVIASASLDHTVKLWDADTGALLRTLAGHTMQVLAARFGRDGRFLITAAGDTTARVFTAAGEPIELLEGHTGVLYDAAITPDGRLAATASTDGTAMVWDANVGTPLWTIDLDDTPVTSVDFSPDGRLLVLAAGDTAEILDVTAGDVPAYELATFEACRVGYELDHGQLERVAPELARCATPP